jgi:hypothetical protein
MRWDACISLGAHLTEVELRRASSRSGNGFCERAPSQPPPSRSRRPHNSEAPVAKKKAKKAAPKKAAKKKGKKK